MISDALTTLDRQLVVGFAAAQRIAAMSISESWLRRAG
jgi:hypothetical protein